MQLHTYIKEKFKTKEIVFIILLCVVSTLTLDKVNPKLIFTLFIAQGIIIFTNRKDFTFTTTYYFWLLILMYSLNIIGMLYTQNISSGGNILTRQISFVLFPLFYTVYKVKNIAFLLKVYVGSIFIFILLFEIDTLYRFFYKSDVFPLNMDLFFSYRYTGAELTKLFEMHNAYFGMYITFSNVLIIHFLKEIKKNYIVALLLLLIVFQSLFLLQLIAKTAIILNALIVIFSLIFFFLKRNKRKILLFATILFCFVGIFSMNQLKLPLSRIGDRFIELKEGASSIRETRVKLWMSAVPIIDKNFFLGKGTGDVQNALHSEYRKRGILSQSNIHNQYLDYLMRFGIIGLVVFLSVFCYSLSHAINTRNYIYFCFIIIIMVCCLTENILSRQWGIVFFSCFNYLLYLNTKHNK